MRKDMYRRKNRIHSIHFDGTAPGMFHVVCCCKHRLHHFGKVEEQNVLLSDIGQITADHLTAIPLHFPEYALDTWKIMPNHLHILLYQTDQRKASSAALGTVIGSFKSSVTRRVNLTLKHFPWELWQRGYYVRQIEGNINPIREYIKHNHVQK